MEQGPSPLSIKGIGKSFKGTVALSDVNLDAIANEKIVGLVGPNGAGKTTLINVVTGYLSPDCGSISYQGRSITSLSIDARVKAGIVRTFQIPLIFDSMTVVDNVAIAHQGRAGASKNFLRKMLVGFPSDAERSEALQILSRFGLEDIAYENSADIPHGRKKMLELAMAYSLNPRILLIDEPFSGLSDAEIREAHSIIKSVAAEMMWVLVVEHKISWLSSLADRIVVMVEGKIIASGAPSEVMRTALVRRMYWGEE